MTNTISEDALNAQQSRIMNALKAQAAPTQQEIAPQDLLQAINAGNRPGGNYLESLKAAQVGQTQGNLAADTGIYNQMKEQVTRGNSNAAAIDKAITDVAGEDPKIYASIAERLHSDSEAITPENAQGKVMKYAAELGINPLAQQEAEAKLQKSKADITKTIAEANQANAAAGIIPQGAPGSNNVVDRSLRGEDYLTQLNPQVADRARALSKGDIPYPSGFMLKQDPILKQALDATLQAYPDYNYATATARKKLMEDMKAGPASKELATLNMTLGHMADLKEAQADLHNKGSRIYNAITNTYGWATDNPAVDAYNANISPLAEELTKAYRGSGGAESDVNRTIKNLSINAGPQQQAAALQKTAKLLASKINSVALRYKKGMGSTDGFTDFIDPAGIKTLNDLGIVFDKDKGFVAGKPPIENAAEQPQESVKVASEPVSSAAVPTKASSSVTIGGKSYIQQNGKWYEK